MLITRTPLRISLGGGGTDLASYYSRFGGLVVAGAISKHVYIGMNRTFTKDYFVRYSEQERVASIREIRHPIFREALALHEMEPEVEIVTLADVPAGTGLGSSGTFTVGLLRALYAYKREHVGTQYLAEEACHIEIDCLRRSSGKQDQYIAAFGGLQCFELQPDGRVQVTPLRIDTETLHELEEHLLLFFTGYSRDADGILAEQRTRSDADDQEMLAALHQVKRIGQETKQALECGQLRCFGELMHEHWMLKRGRSKTMTTGSIDRWYEVGRKSGATGGKLVGAGGGGFLMFYTESPARLRAAMADEGLAELRFTFDQEGSCVIARD